MKLKLLVGLLLVGFAMCVVDGTVNDSGVTVVTEGTVLFVASMNSDGSGEDDTVDLATQGGDLDDVADDTYDRVQDDLTANYFDIPNIIVCNDFSANHHFTVTLDKSGWSLPPNYAGLKTTGATETTEFLVKVSTPSPGGYVADPTKGLVPTGNFGTNYTGLGADATEVMHGGEASHGIEGATFTVDARILFDWLTDIPGDYAVSLTITVVAGS